jgi:hypothetical protein
MQIAETIDVLAKSAPINIVWGPGCCRTGDAGPVNWAHICLAELVRAGRIARVLTANSDNQIANVMNDVDLFPDFHETDFPDLAACALPSVYMFGAAGPAVAPRLIEHGAESGPWIVLGCSGSHFGLGEALLTVRHFEQGLWWIGHFDQPPPARLGPDYFSRERGAHFLGGFDAGSFMAYLTRGLSQFPPAFLSKSGNACVSACPPIGRRSPIRQLAIWLSDFNDRLNAAARNRLPAARKMLEQAAGEHGANYESLVTQAIRIFEMELRKTRVNGHAHAIFLGNLAEMRGPKEATYLLHKELQWIEKYPADNLPPSRAELEAMQLAKTYAHLAKFRTGSEAGALFAKAEHALSSVEPGTLAFAVSIDWARLLAQWADQEGGFRSGDLFERAQQKFEYEETIKRSKALRHLRFTYAQALLKHAASVPNSAAAGLLSTTRSQIERQLEDNANDTDCWMFLGRIAFLEASRTPLNQSALQSAAVRCFEKALTLQAAAAGDIYTNWGAALCESAAGADMEALHLLAHANEKFRQAEQAEPNSRLLHKNWSSCLIREARGLGTPEAWQRAREQAERAEAIAAGSGAYNLACIAAECSDREAVCRWLTRSADYGQISPLAHVLRDESFQRLREDPRFQEMLTGIFV